MDSKETFAQTMVGNKAVITLCATMDMAVSEDFLQVMKMCHQNNYDVTLEAQGVKRLSTPCAQILVSAGSAFDQSKGQFRLLHPSDAMRQAMHDLGLEDALQKWGD